MRFLLLPGMDGTGDLFAPFLSILPAGTNATVISYPSQEKLSYPQLEELVRRQLPEEPFVIIAESFSGPIAVRIAEQAPGNLKGISLSATFVEFPGSFLAKMAAKIFGGALVRFQPPYWAFRRYLGGNDAANVYPLLTESLRKSSREVLHHRIQNIIQVDARAALRQIKIPVLILSGTHDRIVPSHNARQMKHLNKSAVLSEIEAPHLLLQTKPADALKEISRFVSSVS